MIQFAWSFRNFKKLRKIIKYPEIEVSFDKNGTLIIGFSNNHFEKPGKFARWIEEESLYIMRDKNRYFNVKATKKLANRIRFELISSMKLQILEGHLRFDHYTRVWNCSFRSKEPNDIMKELL